MVHKIILDGLFVNKLLYEIFFFFLLSEKNLNSHIVICGFYFSLSINSFLLNSKASAFKLGFISFLALVKKHCAYMCFKKKNNNTFLPVPTIISSYCDFSLWCVMFVMASTGGIEMSSWIIYVLVLHVILCSRFYILILCFLLPCES